MRTNPLGFKTIKNFVRKALGDDLHAKRVLSLANATVGVVHGAALGVSTIGRALAQARGLKAKHAVKQVDRLLSNAGIDVWEAFASWVPMVVAQRTEAVVAFDWTDFDDDDQTSICLYLLTKHGRATPLVWYTVEKSGLKGNRCDAEDMVLRRLHEVLPKGVQVTLLADRGFGDVALYKFLKGELGFDFVIRFRGCIHVTDATGETRTAEEWLRPDGRARLLKDARVTTEEQLIPGVVIVKGKDMKDAWYLATSLAINASLVVKLYGRRFTIEESFRDAKDWRFGMGLVHVRISDCDRRDRLLLISAMAISLLTLLGAAAEAVGLDKTLKVNTVQRRTHSLFSQGVYFYGALPMMKPKEFQILVERFGQLLLAHRFFREVYGLL